MDEAGAPLIDPQLVPKTAEATLYIYRPFRFGSGLASPLITIDGEPIILLHNAGYTRTFLSQGNHVIATMHSEQWVKRNSTTTELDAQEGKTYYLQVIPETRTKYFVIGYGTDFFLALTSEDMAKDELRETHYLKPLNQISMSRE